jgi:cell division topological specificity factor MinE
LLNRFFVLGESCFKEITFSRQYIYSRNSARAKLRYELLEVLSKYVDVDKDQINVQLQRNQNHAVLELNITLPNH